MAALDPFRTFGLLLKSRSPVSGLCATSPLRKMPIREKSVPLQRYAIQSLIGLSNRILLRAAKHKH
jgi:hypothetical protein